jgi:hypothetical protein
MVRQGAGRGTRIYPKFYEDQRTYGLPAQAIAAAHLRGEGVTFIECHEEVE